MKNFILKRIYRFVWYLAQSNPRANLLYGFYRKYPHPDKVKPQHMKFNIFKLGLAVMKEEQEYGD